MIVISMCWPLLFWAQTSNEAKILMENGTYVHFYHDQEGPKAKKGDIMSLHIQTYVNEDSLFFSSYDAKAPIDYNIGDPSFKGDFMSGLHCISEGDSVAFWVSVDSLIKYGVTTVGKKGGYLKYVIKAYALDDAVNFQLKRNKAIDNRFDEEMRILSNYFQANPQDVKRTKSGLHYVINSKGDGPKGQVRRKVKVHYKGWVLNGKEFDSSYKRNEPIGFVLGLKMVIPGWEEALTLLNVGDKATIYIPSKLGYGVKGNGDAIPPNAILVFDMEFVEMN